MYAACHVPPGLPATALKHCAKVPRGSGLRASNASLVRDAGGGVHVRVQTIDVFVTTITQGVRTYSHTRGVHPGQRFHEADHMQVVIPGCRSEAEASPESSTHRPG